jgi:hypothetical protein
MDVVARFDGRAGASHHLAVTDDHFAGLERA